MSGQASQSLIFSDDPYERFIKDETRSKNLIANDRSSKFSRKFKAFKDDMSVKKTYFLYGGMQGFAIGCLAGLGIGAISAFQTKRLMVIPLSMIASGMFFACVMAFGSLIRSADHQYMGHQQGDCEEYEFVEYINKVNTMLAQENKKS